MNIESNRLTKQIKRIVVPIDLAEEFNIRLNCHQAIIFLKKFIEIQVIKSTIQEQSLQDVINQLPQDFFLIFNQTTPITADIILSLIFLHNESNLAKEYNSNKIKFINLFNRRNYILTQHSI